MNTDIKFTQSCVFRMYNNKKHKADYFKNDLGL